jgi:hypothetical protein
MRRPLLSAKHLLVTANVMALVTLGLLHISFRRDVRQLQQQLSGDAEGGEESEVRPGVDDLHGQFAIRVASFERRGDFCTLYFELTNQTDQHLTVYHPQFVFENTAGNIIGTETIAFHQVAPGERKLEKHQFWQVRCSDFARVTLQGVDGDVGGDEICEYGGIRHTGCMGKTVVAANSVIPLHVGKH